VRRELLDLVGSGLLVAGLTLALVGALVPAAATESATPSSTADGRTLFFAKGCSGCHSISALGIRAHVSGPPDLSKLPDEAATRRPGLTSRDYVRESILAPASFVAPGASDATNVMPVLAVNASELDALVAFLLAPR